MPPVAVSEPRDPRAAHPEPVPRGVGAGQPRRARNAHDRPDPSRCAVRELGPGVERRVPGADVARPSEPVEREPLTPIQSTRLGPRRRRPTAAADVAADVVVSSDRLADAPDVARRRTELDQPGRGGGGNRQGNEYRGECKRACHVVRLRRSACQPCRPHLGKPPVMVQTYD